MQGDVILERLRQRAGDDALFTHVRFGVRSFEAASLPTETLPATELPIIDSGFREHARKRILERQGAKGD